MNHILENGVYLSTVSTVLNFVRLRAGIQARWEIFYNIIMAPKEWKQANRTFT